MTPKKLRLQNFLSYPDDKQELDFSLFHVACLTGENGAGKSSLIEAIPWCIWGEGRVGNERLLREGESEMRVEFEFTLDEVDYQIIRIAKRNRGGRVSTDALEFHVRDSATNTFRVVQSGVREAQRRINQTLGIDYDTFISSSFIVQGKSNEFTRKSATERKKILTEILHIDRYQTLSEHAREKARLLENKLKQDVARLELLTEEIKQMPAVEQDIAETTAEIQTLESSELTLKAALAELDAALNKAVGQKAELDAATREASALRDALRQLDKQLSAKQRERQQLDALLSRKADIEARKAEFDQLQQTASELSEKSATAQRLRESQLKLESAIREKKTAKEQTLAFEKNALRELVKELAAFDELAQKKAELVRDRAALENERLALVARTKRATELQEERSAADARAAALKSESATYKSQMEELKRKGCTIRDLKDAVCPLCQSPLTDEHRKKVREELGKVYRDYEAQLKNAEAQLDEIATKLQAIKDEQKDAEKSRDALTQCEKNLARTVQQLDTIAEREREAAKRLEEKRIRQTTIEDIELALQRGDFIEQETAQLNSICAEIMALGYDASQHRQVQARLKELTGIERESAEVENATQNAARLDVELQALSTNVAAQHQRLAQVELQIAALTQAVAQMQTIETTRRKTVSELDVLSANLRDAGGKLKALQTRLDDLKKKRDDASALKVRMKTDRDDEDIYRKLADAFGISGIQSMLIENAVPELERAANDILSKLTSNIAALRIETQREQRNQKVVEALEIKISDDYGNVRPYETFSGGEKFRIDFALRVALSKLLAGQRNAGVKFLVIDEGFGTQDAEGLEAMIDAVMRVSNEFDKIILITHLEKLREYFETKIFVSKEAGRGSRFTVSSATVTD